MSALDNVNVTRLLAYIQESLGSALQQFVFEPNDPLTRDNAAFMIETYLGDLQARSSVYDFKVVCDEANNPKSVIDNNQLICDVYIQPFPGHESLYNIRAAIIGSTLNLDSTVLTKQDYEARYDYAMAILGK